eukprot:4884438-Pyramimonas_sp.AAC.1
MLTECARSAMAGQAGIFSRWTNQTQASRVYSHDGPIVLLTESARSAMARWSPSAACPAIDRTNAACATCACSVPTSGCCPAVPSPSSSCIWFMPSNVSSISLPTRSRKLSKVQTQQSANSAGEKRSRA